MSRQSCAVAGASAARRLVAGLGAPTALGALGALTALGAFTVLGGLSAADAAAAAQPAVTSPLPAGDAPPGGASPGEASPAPSFAPVVPGAPLTFPQDFGSHPEFRTEWWYVTGWLSTASGAPLGFQVTFFRTRPALDERNPSAFTPRQLIVAHCALSDPKRGRLWQDQRIERVGFGDADARTGDTAVWIGRWDLKRTDARYVTNIDAEDFALHLTLTPTQPPLLNGLSGVSRKGPNPTAASYYYSLPHMRVAGTIARSGTSDAVTGEAWFDHEWSSEYLDAQAVGWDWTGINLDDGSALMAFRIRGRDGTTRWAGATLRSARGTVEALDTPAVDFRPLRSWRSPRTGIVYPVAWRVRAGALELELEPLLEDQENDTRLTTGAIYWEGAVRALEAGHPVGRGYLELTGYGEPLRLR